MFNTRYHNFQIQGKSIRNFIWDMLAFCWQETQYPSDDPEPRIVYHINRSLQKRHNSSGMKHSFHTSDKHFQMKIHITWLFTATIFPKLSININIWNWKNTFQHLSHLNSLRSKYSFNITCWTVKLWLILQATYIILIDNFDSLE